MAVVEVARSGVVVVAADEATIERPDDSCQGCIKKNRSACPHTNKTHQSIRDSSICCVFRA